MLKKINNKRVESSEGFIVEYINIHELRYIEGDRVAAIEIEPGPNDFSVYTQTLTTWLPPYECDVITEEKRNRIIKNIQAALTFLGVKHVIN